MKKVFVIFIAIVLLVTMMPVCNAESKEKYKLWNLSLVMSFSEAERYLNTEKGIVMKRYDNGLGTKTAEDITVMGFPCSLLYWDAPMYNQKFFDLQYKTLPYNNNEIYKVIIPALIEKYAEPNQICIEIYSDGSSNWSSTSYSKPMYYKNEEITFDSKESIEEFDIKKYCDEWEHTIEKTQVRMRMVIGNIVVAINYYNKDNSINFDIKYYESDMTITGECGEFTKNINSYEDTGF